MILFGKLLRIWVVGTFFETFVLFYIKRQLLKIKSVASGTHFHLAVWLQFLWRVYHGTIPAAPPSPPTQAPHQKNFDTYLLKLNWIKLELASGSNRLHQ